LEINKYILKGGSEEDVVVKPHGNSKFCKRPYYKTDQGVLDKLKDEPTHVYPLEINNKHCVCPNAGRFLLTYHYIVYFTKA
jgi:hypothetical protein